MGERTLQGRKAVLVSWANTVDRERRTRNARQNSPTHVEWHLARLPEKFANATDDQRFAAAEAARKAYMTGLSMKAAAARKRNARRVGS